MTPPRATLSLPLFFPSFFLSAARTRRRINNTISSVVSPRETDGTGRDGVRNHIFQVMPVNAANKGPGNSVPGPVSMAYASGDLDGQPNETKKKKKNKERRNINYAHHYVGSVIPDNR